MNNKNNGIEAKLDETIELLAKMRKDNKEEHEKNIATRVKWLVFKSNHKGFDYWC